MAFSSNDPRNYIAWARQNTESAEPASFSFVKYLGDSGFNLEQDTESVFEGGDGQDQGLHYKSRVRADGQISFYARPDAFTRAAAWAMGSAAAVGTNVGIGTSIYVPNATVPHVTIEQAWGGGNQIDRVRSAIFTGIEIEAEAGQPWRVTVPFIGGGTPFYRDGAASALTPTLESGDPAMYAGGAYLVDGATSLDIRRWNLAFNRGVDDDLFTTEVFRRKVVPLTRSLELTFQMIFQDSTLYKQIAYNGGSVVTNTLATGAFHAERILTASQYIAVDVPNLRYTAVSANRLEPDGETVVLDVSAMAVKAATSIVQLRVNHSALNASGILNP